MHTSHLIRQGDWHTIHLAQLIDQGYTHLFLWDDDDFYYTKHIEEGQEKLQEGDDHAVNQLCAGILLKNKILRLNGTAALRRTHHAVGLVQCSLIENSHCNYCPI